MRAAERITLKMINFQRVKGGEASSWDYGQKLKKHIKHFFAKFQLFTIYGFLRYFISKLGDLPDSVAS